MGFDVSLRKKKGGPEAALPGASGSPEIAVGDDQAGRADRRVRIVLHGDFLDLGHEGRELDVAVGDHRLRGLLVGDAHDAGAPHTEAGIPVATSITELDEVRAGLVLEGLDQEDETIQLYLRVLVLDRVLGRGHFVQE